MRKGGSPERALRFDWDEPSEDPTNWTNLILIMSEIQARGAQYSPACTEMLKIIQPEHLQERVVDKFRRLRREYIAHNIGPDIVDGQGDSEGTYGMDNEEEGSVITTLDLC